MYPTFEVFGTEVQLFLLCICFGFTVSSFVVLKLGKITGLQNWWIFLVGFWFFGRLGQELFYNFAQQLPISFGVSGGSTILGSIAGSFILVPLLAQRRNMDWKSMADFFVLPLLILQVSGKLGCFWEGCCYGSATSMPWGVHSSISPLVYIHPTQLYEFVALLFLLLFLLTCAKYAHIKVGALAGMYLCLYGIERFLVEFIRGDAVRSGILGLTSGQVLSVIFLVIGLTMLVRCRQS